MAARKTVSQVEQPVVSSYEQVVSYLTSYAHQDWLGLEVITNSVRDCFDHKPNPQISAR